MRGADLVLSTLPFPWQMACLLLHNRGLRSHWLRWRRLAALRAAVAAAAATLHLVQLVRRCWVHAAHAQHLQPVFYLSTSCFWLSFDRLVAPLAAEAVALRMAADGLS